MAFEWLLRKAGRLLLGQGWCFFLFLHCSLLLRNASHTWVGFLEAKGQHFTPYSKRTPFPQALWHNSFPLCLFPPPLCLRKVCCLFSHLHLPISSVRRDVWWGPCWHHFAASHKQTHSFLRKQPAALLSQPQLAERNPRVTVLDLCQRHYLCSLDIEWKHNGFYTCWHFAIPLATSLRSC